MREMNKEQIENESLLLRHLGFTNIENEYTYQIVNREIVIYFEDRITIPYTYEPNKYYVFDIDYSVEEPIAESYDIIEIAKYL